MAVLSWSAYLGVQWWKMPKFESGGRGGGGGFAGLPCIVSLVHDAGRRSFLPGLADTAAAGVRRPGGFNIFAGVDI
jgi:hypothetical protein